MTKEIVPQWAVSAAFNDGSRFVENHVAEMFDSMRSSYSLGEKLLIEDFMDKVFSVKPYSGKIGQAKLDCIDKWCFGKE